MTSTILFLEPEESAPPDLVVQLAQSGLRLARAHGLESLAYYEDETPRLVVVGCYRADVMSTIGLVKRARRRFPDVPIVVVATVRNESLAVSAFRLGVHDYFRWPRERKAMLAMVKKWCNSCDNRHYSKRQTTDNLIGQERLVGGSAAMQDVRAQILRIARSNRTVLVTGETGTGKELVASIVHQNSVRAERPLLHFNCAAIPDSLLENELFGHERGAFTGAVCFQEGKLKSVDGGTVFLDEIGDMSALAQAKVLRLLESNEIQRLGASRSSYVDLRFVAATNQRLEDAVRVGRFRKDLFYRLNVLRLQLPPLRERTEDIPMLCHHYLERLRGEINWAVTGFDHSVFECFRRYDWPGNVRELRNVLDAISVHVREGRVCTEHLPEGLARINNSGDVTAERQRFLRALLATNWNKSQTAKALKCSRMTLYRKIAKYRLGRDMNL